MKKFIHLKQASHQRKKAHIMSVLLPNGNMVVPKIMARDPFVSCWVEVEPSSLEFKRWRPRTEKNHPDPRTMPGYLAQLADNDPDGKFRHTLKGVYKPAKGE